MSLMSDARQKFLPLREITLHSRPLVKRAIALSCDGELAVAADDSVHVFVPEFPDLAKRRQDRKERRKARAAAAAINGMDLNGDDNDHQQSDNENGNEDRHVDRNEQQQQQEKGEFSSSDDDDDEETAAKYRGNIRAQYSEGSKHMPVSYPPLDPRINRELFTAAGFPFPYDKVKGDESDEGDDSDGEEDGHRVWRAKKAGRRSRSDDEDEDDDDEEGENETGEVIGGRFNIPNRPFGSGYGPITGVGSSMNHVVHMAWSPSGLGINRRPILAILSGSGTLAMYGDGNCAANILPRANEGMLQHRELTSWMVLWGVGERLMVPGQQADVSENVRGFAWAKEIAPGQALLATVNDLMEVAIVSVQSVYRVQEGGKGKGSGKVPGMVEAGESLVWLVQEVARFEARGPHPKGNVNDEDWMPYGTSFGINWTPWLRTEDSMTCIISFVDRNYIGFRRITVKTPWARGHLPQIEVDKQDIFGKCLHLSTDAFVEFENAIWTMDEIKKCRGVVVTGFKAMPFEIALAGGAKYSHEPHSTTDCGTVYPDVEDDGLQNPIVDLVIHAPDPCNPTPTPLYTLVRASATVDSSDWYESNIEVPDIMTDGGRSEDDDLRPQWARDIQQKLDIAIPVSMHMKHGYEGESDSDDEVESGSDDDMDDEEYEDDDGIEVENENPPEQVPEIHPHRFRMHGLTVSAGGWATAVLASHHSTQNPERGGWHTVRSTILFGYKPRRPRPALYDRLPRSPSLPDEAEIPPLTTEAKLFEWLYGGGPAVPGVNAPPEKANTSSDDETGEDSSEQARLRTLFKPAIDQQMCDLCGSKMTENKRGALSGCEKGHYFGTCATSGLAVQMPGITRSCGACGLRTIRTEVLVGKMPAEKKDEVIRAVGEGVCGGCGGKFLT